MADDTTGRRALPGGDGRALASAWRRFGWVATLVAVLTSPAAFIWFHSRNGWSLGWSILATILVVAAFRGVVDVLLRQVIPWPSLFGHDDVRKREADATNRRRAWFWRFWVRLAVFILAIITIIFLIRLETRDVATWTGTAGDIFGGIGHIFSSRQFWLQVVFVPALFLINFLILFGPLVIMGASQIRGFEPGDAKWGVDLEDVRGQAEAKEEIRRIVALWQSGEAFEAAGGKRERGILFFGAPGTGKTMLAKGIATSFNCPFVSIPGSGFAQTFIGMDAVIVRYLARKAKKLARKWGGQCIVFIDEIDAVGMRRSSLAGAPGRATPAATVDPDGLFFGPWGALNPSGDLVLETRAWRERLFAERAPATPSPYPPFVHRLGGIVDQMIPGMFGGGGGQLALNQLLVVMDGIDNPPFLRRTLVSRVNLLLDALYVVPRRIGNVSLRLPPARPRKDQIYFIGATNVPLESLDPALTRPGRMGRHVWFRTPQKHDRKDIFDLYLQKVTHEAELDTDERRDELARITNGYSPAMIEQVCSMALTYAHHDGREAFGWEDLVEAMTTVESGTAVGVEYIPEETRAVAIHEAGHAICAHVYMQNVESTRISIRQRGGSLGHHQAMEKEERFSSWRHEDMGRLIWTLGAMAAEHVFYGENSRGVGGDVYSATSLAATMVGSWAMAPERVELNGEIAEGDDPEEARKKIMKRFEAIGTHIMRRSGGGMMDADPTSGVLSDRDKRAFVGQLLGQAYVAAYLLIAYNRDAVERLAERLIERKEIYGNELVRMLDEANPQIPYVDLTKEESWPVL